MRCRIIVRAQPGHKVEGPGRRFMRKASCGSAAFLAESLWLSDATSKLLRLRLQAAEPRILNIQIGKPEAFRTGGGKAASGIQLFGCLKPRVPAGPIEIHEAQTQLNSTHRLSLRVCR